MLTIWTRYGAPHLVVPRGLSDVSSSAASRWWRTWLLLQDDVAAQQCAARQLEWRGYRDVFYISTVGDVANHGDVEQLGFGVPLRFDIEVNRFPKPLAIPFRKRSVSVLVIDVPRPRTLNCFSSVSGRKRFPFRNRYRFRFGTPLPAVFSIPESGTRFGGSGSRCPLRTREQPELIRLAQRWQVRTPGRPHSGMSNATRHVLLLS